MQSCTFQTLRSKHLSVFVRSLRYPPIYNDVLIPYLLLTFLSPQPSIEDYHHHHHDHYHHQPINVPTAAAQTFPMDYLLGERTHSAGPVWIGEYYDCKYSRDQRVHVPFEVRRCSNNTSNLCDIEDRKVYLHTVKFCDGAESIKSFALLANQNKQIITSATY
jgi:hypothetical protein